MSSIQERINGFLQGTIYPHFKETPSLTKVAILVLGAAGFYYTKNRFIKAVIVAVTGALFLKSNTIAKFFSGNSDASGSPLTEHSQRPIPAPAPLPSCMTVLDGAKVLERIRKGKTTCLDYTTDPAHPPERTIFLNDSIYEVKVDGLPQLVMTIEDFRTLRDSVCHDGAFGNDHRMIDTASLTTLGLQAVRGFNYVIVWKLPADLKFIASYVVDRTVKYTDVNVGSYRLSSDMFSRHLSADNVAVLEPLTRW